MNLTYRADVIKSKYALKLKENANEYNKLCDDKTTSKSYKRSLKGEEVLLLLKRMTNHAYSRPLNFHNFVEHTKVKY